MAQGRYLRGETVSAGKRRRPGSRDRLTSTFIAKLADDFEANHGAESAVLAGILVDAESV